MTAPRPATPRAGRRSRRACVSGLGRSVGGWVRGSSPASSGLEVADATRCRGSAHPRIAPSRGMPHSRSVDPGCRPRQGCRTGRCVPATAGELPDEHEATTRLPPRRGATMGPDSRARNPRRCRVSEKVVQYGRWWACTISSVARSASPSPSNAPPRGTSRRRASPLQDWLSDEPTRRARVKDGEPVTTQSTACLILPQMRWAGQGQTPQRRPSCGTGRPPLAASPFVGAGRPHDRRDGGRQLRQRHQAGVCGSSLWRNDRASQPCGTRISPRPPTT